MSSSGGKAGIEVDGGNVEMGGGVQCNGRKVAEYRLVLELQDNALFREVTSIRGTMSHPAPEKWPDFPKSGRVPFGSTCARSSMAEASQGLESRKHSTRAFINREKITGDQRKRRRRRRKRRSRFQSNRDLGLYSESS